MEILRNLKEDGTPGAECMAGGEVRDIGAVWSSSPLPSCQ